MNQENELYAFCQRVKDKLGSSECLSFASRLESIIALFDVIELRAHDCVFVSALAPRDILGAVMMCGAVPVLCDVSPDTLTIDHKSLEKAVDNVLSDGKLYPRAVIADNFCGMPSNLKVIDQICSRMGLLLIEDCGDNFGGSSDMGICGSIGDYALISLGGSTAFASGGKGALLIANGDNAAEEFLYEEKCGSMYQSADEYYGSQLCEGFDSLDERLEQSRGLAKELEALADGCDCWIQRGSNRFKSSYGSLAVVAQDKEHCREIMSALQAEDFGRYVSFAHSHVRGCFDRAFRGAKDITNSLAISQKCFIIDVFLLINEGKTSEFKAFFEKMADSNK